MESGRHWKRLPAFLIDNFINNLYPSWGERKLGAGSSQVSIF